MNKEQLKDVIKWVDKLIINWVDQIVIKSKIKEQLQEQLGKLKWYQSEAERLKMHRRLGKAIDELSTKIREIS